MYTLQQLQTLFPMNIKIFVTLRKVQKSGNRLVDAYMFYLDGEGDIQSRWLNGYIRQLKLATLNDDEHIILVGTDYTIDQEIAERLGKALYNDKSAFRYQTL